MLLMVEYSEKNERCKILNEIAHLILFKVYPIDKHALKVVC